jgi:hypothetical protein
MQSDPTIQHPIGQLLPIQLENAGFVEVAKRVDRHCGFVGALHVLAGFLARGVGPKQKRPLSGASA